MASSSSSSSSPAPSPASFTGFPDDVQINILSFLSTADISAFACTSRHFYSLCSPSSPSSSPLYLAVCLRRWGSETLIPSWTSSDFPLLYRTLDRWAPLVGFWSQICDAPSANHPLGASPLVLFEWGPSSITACRISPSTDPCSYDIVKTPFLRLGISENGKAVSRLSFPGVSESDLVNVSVSLVGENTLVVGDEGELVGSPEDRTSPDGEETRRVRRKTGGRRGRWEAEYFSRVMDCCPTPGYPL